MNEAGVKPGSGTSLLEGRYEMPLWTIDACTGYPYPWLSLTLLFYRWEAWVEKRSHMPRSPGCMWEKPGLEVDVLAPLAESLCFFHPIKHSQGEHGHDPYPQQDTPLHCSWGPCLLIFLLYYSLQGPQGLIQVTQAHMESPRQLPVWIRNKPLKC